MDAVTSRKLGVGGGYVLSSPTKQKAREGGREGEVDGGELGWGRSGAGIGKQSEASKGRSVQAGGGIGKQSEQGRSVHAENR